VVSVTNQSADPIGDRKWLTLGLARTLLGINEATLRQWADHGQVRAFRTPGGHRRFSTEDIYSLIESSTDASAAGLHLADSTVLPRIRRMVRGESHAHVPAWMERFDDEGHQRMRLLGREFLELCTTYIEDPGNAETLEAASALGKTYGTEIASRDVQLSDALQAFMFFRNATMEALKPTMIKQGATADEAYVALDHLGKLTNQVLLSLTSCYAQNPLHTTPTKTKHPSQRAGNKR
jgi:excisionase family DNA binding protein